jgi:hypothetical protein
MFEHYHGQGRTVHVLAIDRRLKKARGEQLLETQMSNQVSLINLRSRILGRACILHSGLMPFVGVTFSLICAAWYKLTCFPLSQWTFVAYRRLLV